MKVLEYLPSPGALRRVVDVDGILAVEVGAGGADKALFLDISIVSGCGWIVRLRAVSRA